MVKSRSEPLRKQISLHFIVDWSVAVLVTRRIGTSLYLYQGGKSVGFGLGLPTYRDCPFSPSKGLIIDSTFHKLFL